MNNKKILDLNKPLLIFKLFVKMILVVVYRLKYMYMSLMDMFCSCLLTTQFLSCGENTHIYYPFNLTGPAKLKVGNNVHINRNAFIKADGGLSIGDNVHIARHCTIYTENHNYRGKTIPYDETFLYKPVVIEDNVWIGINVTVIPGVRIGEGAIIGAGTVVSRDVPPLAIIGSAPQRIIRYRNKEHYETLVKAQKFGGVGGGLLFPTS